MLAVCLSGTPGQLYTLTPQAEDGTFSRITCYHIPFKMEFRNVLVERTSYEQGKDVSLRDRFYQLGIKYKLMRELSFVAEIIVLLFRNNSVMSSTHITS